MKKWILLVAPLSVLMVLGILTGFVAQPGTDNGRYLVLRVYENFSVTSSKIIVNYPDSTFEVIPLEPFKYNDEYLVRNGRTLARTLNMLSDKGYRIVTSIADGKPTSNRSMMITTIIMSSHP
ncbi:MAG: hypothetical protein NTW10_08570 [Bacteroidetes bacterium]|nr:hypothetical protein [Bacteroidota bacterium]MCX6306190.1 hypothetical protein [Bacteroidota bacterium]